MYPSIEIFFKKISKHALTSLTLHKHSDGDKIILNQGAGHLLRTKESTNKEGGVVAGASALDSPRLV